MDGTLRGASHDVDDRTRWGALLALAVVGFVCIVAETIPAGLLPQIAADLRVGEAAVGQWITVFAAASVLTTVPLITATRSLARKPLMLGALAAFALSTALTAAASDYTVAIIARAAGGVAAGMLWGMLAGYVRRLATPRQAGRALAIAMGGIPLALAVGTPLGTALGSLVDWRWTFTGLAAIAGVLWTWIAVGVPSRPGQPRRDRTPLHRIIAIPGIAPVLITCLTWMLGHNVLYTYIAPYLRWSDADARVDVVLLVFGAASIVGNAVVGAAIDRALRSLTLGSLIVFASTSTALALGGGDVVLWMSIVAWGLSFGGAAALLLTALADAAGTDGDVAQSLMTTTWNIAIAVGAACGGVLLEALGPASLPPTVAVLALLALVSASAARRNGFVAGRRGELTVALRGEH